MSPRSSSSPNRQGAGPAAAAGPHLPGGEPDPEIDQPDKFLVVGPPGQRQVDDRDELISASRFAKRDAFPLRDERGAHATLLDSRRGPQAADPRDP
ncbi:MAG TPA: hypothetical protein VJY15_09365 [Candidatus Acidoferrum sp.]|nr:hypothetical protein [Candidatus Acidoferrum sp.]